MMNETVPNGFVWINTFVNDFKVQRLPYYKKKLDYYEGNHPILNRTMEEGKQNTRLVFQFPKMIIDTAHSYLVGKPITYANNKSLDSESFASTDEFVKRLQDIFIENDEGFHTAELLKNTSICGDGYEYVYVNTHGDIKIMEFPATECIPIYSQATKELECVLRYYEMEIIALDGTKSHYYNIEVYSSTDIKYYTMISGRVEVDLDRETIVHGCGEVPVVHYRNTRVIGKFLGKSDIDDVETLVDEFNERASDLSNTLQYNGNPLLKLSGCTITTDKLNEMIQKRAIQLPEGADANYLVWDQQINAVEKHLERLQDCILTFSSTPKLYKDNDEGNPMSGISIKMKFSGADLKANNKERNYRQGLRKRVRLIAKLLELTEATNFNWKDVDIIFNRSIPQNITEIAELVVKLKGTVSDETLIGLIPFVVDVKTELERVSKQEGNTTTEEEVKDDTVVEDVASSIETE